MGRIIRIRQYLCPFKFSVLMKKYLEKYLLPIAMVIGISFHKQLALLSPAIPWLLAVMLFITYSRVSWSDIKITKFQYILLSIQYIGSALLYLALRPINEVLAQAAMICVLTATATSAPVVAGILGGSIAATAAYSIISNLSVAFVDPLFLSAIGGGGDPAILHSILDDFAKSDAGTRTSFVGHSFCKRFRQLPTAKFRMPRFLLSICGQRPSLS